MPPKVARGGTRGRGRGRGGKAVGADASIPNAEAETQMGETTIATTSPESKDPPTKRPVDQSSAAQNTGQNASQPSPNSSPASIPTETPAPTPIRAPVQRLDSLGGPARGGVSSGRGRGDASASRGTKSKFKPKAIRRDISERQKLEDEEKARLAGIEQKNADIAARAARGVRGRGGRGRGDAMGRSFGRGLSTASGPFAVAPTISDRRPGLFGPGAGPKREGGSSSGQGDRSGGVSSFRLKTEPGSSSALRGSAYFGGNNYAEPQYPGEDDEKRGPRVDIEHINLISDDESNDPTEVTRHKIKGKKVANKSGLRPVRVPREEHKDRVTLVNTDPATAEASLDDDGNQLDINAVNEKLEGKAQKSARVWKGVYQDDDDILVKSEPEASAGNELHAITSAPSSPESKRSIKILDPSLTEVDKEPLPLKKVKSRKTKTPSKKPEFQTEEDKAEYERHIEDLAILADELGNLQTDTGASAKGKGPADDVMDAENDLSLDKKEGRLYLFQFPPVLPRLYNSNKDQNTNSDDIEMTGSSNAAPVDLVMADGEEVVIKNEPGIIQLSDPLIPEEGYLGKMIVRESGKVELSWGGNSMVVGRGVDAKFLQTVVLTDFKEDQTEGVATGLGSLMGKFVVTPDFANMF